MQYIRERATSKFAKFLFLGIIISFFGFGGSGLFDSMNDSTAAKVNGEKISTSTLSNAYTNYLQNNGGSLPEGADARSVKMQVLNGLIQEIVIAQAAEKMGIMASDEEVRSAILSMSFLKNSDGQFDPDLYKFYLQQQGLTAAQWEANLRQQLTLQMLINAIGTSAIVTESSLEDFAKIDREKRDLTVVTLPFDQFKEEVNVTDEMIATYYEQNKDKLLTDPRVKLSYVNLPELSLDDVSITEEEVNQKVAESKAKAKENETRDSDQLIIQFSTDAEKEAALAFLNNIYDELTKGSLTYEEAKEQVVAQPDGLFYATGVVKKSSNMQPTDEALFALAKDEKFSQPVVTENAVHLIHVLAINDGSDVPDDQLIADARNELLKAKRELQNAEHVQHFQEVAEKNSDTLDLLAEEFKVTPVTTDWLSLVEKNGELNDANTLQVITQEMVLSGGKNSEAYHTDNEEIRIVRVEAFEDARPLTLEEATPEIKAALVEIEAQKKFEALIADINEQLKSNDQSAESIFADHGFAINHYDGVETRTIFDLVKDQPELIEPLIRGFEVQKTEPVTFQGFVSNELATGVSVNNVIPGSLDEYSAEEKEQLKQRLKADIAQAETILFIEGLFDQSKIETYQVPFLAE